MSAKLYQVKLSADERRSLTTLLRKGTAKARLLTRARVLLLADEGRTDEEIASALRISPSTAHRLRQRCATEGVSNALQEKARPGAVPKLNAHQEAQLTALACSEAPDGRARWSLRLLADKMVELKLVDSISHRAVGEYLKKTTSSRGNTGTGVSDT